METLNLLWKRAVLQVFIGHVHTIVSCLNNHSWVILISQFSCHHKLNNRWHIQMFPMLYGRTLVVKKWKRKQGRPGLDSIRSIMRICPIMPKNMEKVNLMTPFHIRLNKSWLFLNACTIRHNQHKPLLERGNFIIITLWKGRITSLFKKNIITTWFHWSVKYIKSIAKYI